MRVVVTECDDEGNVDFDDLAAKAAEMSDQLACLMLTYPSTHGVYEQGKGHLRSDSPTRWPGLHGRCQLKRLGRRHLTGLSQRRCLAHEPA